MVMKCLGQDMRDWKEGDIFEVTCPWCAIGKVEFFKDEPRRKCTVCGKEIKVDRKPDEPKSNRKYCDHCLLERRREVMY